MIHRGDPWKKSSHSDINGACLEVRLRDEVQIRTSSNSAIPSIKVSVDAWACLISAIQTDTPFISA